MYEQLYFTGRNISSQTKICFFFSPFKWQIQQKYCISSVILTYCTLIWMEQLHCECLILNVQVHVAPHFLFIRIQSTTVSFVVVISRQPSAICDILSFALLQIKQKSIDCVAWMAKWYKFKGERCVCIYNTRIQLHRLLMHAYHIYNVAMEYGIHYIPVHYTLHHATCRMKYAIYAHHRMNGRLSNTGWMDGWLLYYVFVCLWLAQNRKLELEFAVVFLFINSYANMGWIPCVSVCMRSRMAGVLCMAVMS